jgi:RNA polymerase sigma-70 factor (ECF subfamily)
VATEPGLPPASDAQLVDAARTGAEWAREALYRRHARMANGLAYRLLGNDAELDDLVQDCFVIALTTLDRLAEPSAFSGWLGGIVVRQAHKRLRRRRMLVRFGLRRSEPVDLDAIVRPGLPPDVAMELRRVYSAIDELPAEERIALVLRRVEGLELAEVATRMGLSLATVKRRLERADTFLAVRFERGTP